MDYAMATVNIYFLDQIAYDANGRNTFGFSDHILGRDRQTITVGAGNAVEITAPVSSMFMMIETDGNLRYETRGSRAGSTFAVDPPNDGSPPVTAQPFVTQGPIPMQEGQVIKIRAYS